MPNLMTPLELSDDDKLESCMCKKVDKKKRGFSLSNCRTTMWDSPSGTAASRAI